MAITVFDILKRSKSTQATSSKEACISRTSLRSGYKCTLKSGHPGKHEAGVGADLIAAEWD